MKSNQPVSKGNQDGYAMAALLVAMSVAAVMMTVAMPAWKQMAKREKEEELIFRGTQYVRALRLFGTKYANASPPNVDILVEQRFIRKKFKDPITNDDFQPILAGQAVPGAPASPQPGSGGRGQTGQTSPSGRQSGSQSGSSPFGNGIGGSARAGGAGTGNAGGPATPLSPAGASGGGISSIGTPGAGATGGVIGVVSKSKDKSLRLYNGRSHYNEWAFIGTQQTQTPGAGGRGTATPGNGGRRGQPPNPANPFGNGIGGPPNQPPNAPGGRTFGPGTSPFPPGTPRPPVQPIQPPRRPGD
jgi:type II secretory pathway pseudopilin PulG